MTMKKTAMLAFPIVMMFVFLPLWVYAQQGAQSVAPPESDMTTHSGAGPTGSPGHGGGGSHDHGGQAAVGSEGRGSHDDHRSGDMDKRKDMQGRHEQRMARMKEMDARLDEKLAAMNSAQGDKKIEAMGAVISEMVAQRKAFHEMMASAHEERENWKKDKGRSEGHGGAGGHGGGGSGGCPMMKKHGSHGGGGGQDHGDHGGDGDNANEGSSQDRGTSGPVGSTTSM